MSSPAPAEEPKTALLGPDWPGWKFADTEARFWGVRALGPDSPRATQSLFGTTGIAAYEDVAGRSCRVRFLGGKEGPEMEGFAEGIRRDTRIPAKINYTVDYAECEIDLKGNPPHPEFLAFYLQGILGPAILV